MHTLIIPNVKLGYIVNSTENVLLDKLKQAVETGAVIKLVCDGGKLEGIVKELSLTVKTYSTVVMGKVEIESAAGNDDEIKTFVRYSFKVMALSSAGDLQSVISNTYNPSISMSNYEAFAWCEYHKDSFYVPIHLRNPDNEYVKNWLKGLMTTRISRKALNDFMEAMPVRTVVCAANRILHEDLPDGELIVPANRHHSPTMNKLLDVLLLRRKDLPREMRDEQGFIDQWGTFMDRKEALYVAANSGQPLNMLRNGSTDELYSEGLY